MLELATRSFSTSLVVAGLLSIFSISGSLLYLSHIKQSEIGTSNKVLTSIILQGEQAILTTSDNVTRHFPKPHLDKNEDALMKKLDQKISESLCDSSLECKFDQRHLPKFVQFLNKNESAIFKRMQRNTLLVVTFNRVGNYFTAPLVYALYRRLFAHIYFCGPSKNATDLEQDISTYFEDSHIKEYFSQNYLSFTIGKPYFNGFGENNYLCFNLALHQLAKDKPHAYKNIDGVFVMADDAFTGFWNIAFNHSNLLDLNRSYSLPFPKLVYHTETLKKCNLQEEPSECNQTNPWENWPVNYQRPVSRFYHVSDFQRKRKCFH